MSVKVKAYKDLEQFLSDQRQDLAALFDLVSLPIRQSYNGLTLLLPSKDYVKELLQLYKGDTNTLKKYTKETEFLVKEQLVDSDTVGESLVAWLLDALILTKQYNTHDDFTDPVINKLYKIYKVKSHKKGVVELDIGTVTPMDVKFIKSLGASKNKQNKLAVWALKGKPDIMTPTYVNVKTIPSGGSTSCDISKSIRENIYDTVKHHHYETINCQIKTDRMELIFIVALMKYIRVNNSALYEKLLPVLDWDPLVSFMLVFSPGSDQCLVDNELESWFRNDAISIEPSAKEDYRSMMDEAAAKFPSNMAELVGEERISAHDRFTSAGVSSKVIITSYNKAYDNNSNLSKTPSYTDNITLRINYDFLRQRLHTNLCVPLEKLYNAASANVSQSENYAKEAMKYFAQIEKEFTNIDKKLVSTLNPSFWTSMVSRDKELDNAIRTFVYSSEFIYYPKSDAVVSAMEYNVADLSSLQSNTCVNYIKQRYDKFSEIKFVVPNVKKEIAALAKLGYTVSK